MIAPTIDPVSIIEHTIKREQVLLELPILGRNVKINYSTKVGADYPIFRHGSDSIRYIDRLTQCFCNIKEKVPFRVGASSAVHQSRLLAVKSLVKGRNPLLTVE